MDQKLDQVLHLLNSVVYTQQHLRSTGASGSGLPPAGPGSRHGSTDLPTPTTPLHPHQYSPPHSGMAAPPSGSVHAPQTHISSTSHMAPPSAATLTLTDHLQDGDV